MRAPIESPPLAACSGCGGKGGELRVVERRDCGSRAEVFVCPGRCEELGRRECERR